MKVLQDFFVSLKDARFVVFDRLLTAEGLDNLAGFAVVVSRHGRKQVMLYLVIQAARRSGYGRRHLGAGSDRSGGEAGFRTVSPNQPGIIGIPGPARAA